MTNINMKTLCSSRMSTWSLCSIGVRMMRVSYEKLSAQIENFCILATFIASTSLSIRLEFTSSSPRLWEKIFPNFRWTPPPPLATAPSPPFGVVENEWRVINYIVLSLRATAVSRSCKCRVLVVMAATYTEGAVPLWRQWEAPHHKDAEFRPTIRSGLILRADSKLNYWPRKMKEWFSPKALINMIKECHHTECCLCYLI